VSAPDPVTFQGVRVLVVDGSVAVGIRLSALLREAAHEVIGLAGTAQAATDQARAMSPDVIVIDPHLPDRSGPEIVAVLKICAPTAVVVVLSSDPQPRYRVSCETYGADYFFDKATEFDSVAPTLAIAGAQSGR
jgi:DNA-binding NarL/FixJ family response regulator